MTKVLVTRASLEDTAGAIRTKLGVQTTYKPSQFAAAIGSISTQANLGTKTISSNGTYNASGDSLDGYSSVVVSVPTGSHTDTIKEDMRTSGDSLGEYLYVIGKTAYLSGYARNRSTSPTYTIPQAYRPVGTVLMKDGQSGGGTTRVAWVTADGTVNLEVGTMAYNFSWLIPESTTTFSFESHITEGDNKIGIIGNIAFYQGQLVSNKIGWQRLITIPQNLKPDFSRNYKAGNCYVKSSPTSSGIDSHFGEDLNDVGINAYLYNTGVVYVEAMWEIGTQS